MDYDLYDAEDLRDPSDFIDYDATPLVYTAPDRAAVDAAHADVTVLVEEVRANLPEPVLRAKAAELADRTEDLLAYIAAGVFPSAWIPF